MSIKTMTRRVEAEATSIETLTAARDKAVATIADIERQYESASASDIGQLSEKQYQLQHRLTGYTQALEAAKKRLATARGALLSEEAKIAKAEAVKRSKDNVKRLEREAVIPLVKIVDLLKDVQDTSIAKIEQNSRRFGSALQYPDMQYHQLLNAYIGDSLKQGLVALNDFLKHVNHGD